MNRVDAVQNDGLADVGSILKLRVLRLLLLGMGLGWLVALIGLILPWPITIAFLEGLGAGSIPQDPMLEYWCRMATGVFTGVGVVFLLLAHRPDRFAGILPVVSILLVLEGVVLLVTGLKNRLPPLPFYPGAALCLIFGTGIWILRKEASNKFEATR